jgi:peptide/nickel transport system ATP-binding protein
MAVPVLSVRELSVTIPGEDGVVQAVDKVSYEVHPGETVAIVGESGSGKSVSSLAVMGLMKRTGAEVTGSVELSGADLTYASEGDLRAIRGNKMSMVFQDPLSSLHPFYTVGRQLNEALKVHGRASGRKGDAHASELLRVVGIPDPEGCLRSYPHELSGGMRQRVMIAMALMNDPEVLIADEPTTALDVTVQAQILELIDRLREEREMAVVLISHDLGVVARMADRVVVMYAGRIVESGTSHEVFYRAEHPYTWGLLESIPRLDLPEGYELVGIPGQPPSLISPPTGCRFHPRCPYAQPKHALERPPLASANPDSRGSHLVACHLSSDQRKTLWRERSANRSEAPAASPQRGMQ